MHSFITIGTLNCQGLNDFYKRSEIFDSLRKSDLSIILLQETKLHPERERIYMNEWHGDSIFNSVVGSKSGTAILINKTSITFSKGSKMTDVEGRVIAVDMEMFGTRFHVVNSYGPNESRLKIPFLNRLHLYLNSNVTILWGGRS